jgi:hypothetical protein
VTLPLPTTPGLTTPWRQLVLTLNVLEAAPLPALDELAWTTDKADRAWPHVAGGTLMAVRGPRETPLTRIDLAMTPPRTPDQADLDAVEAVLGPTVLPVSAIARALPTMPRQTLLDALGELEALGRAVGSGPAQRTLWRRPGQAEARPKGPFKGSIKTRGAP